MTESIESVKRRLCKDLGFASVTRRHWSGRRDRELVKPIQSGKLEGLLRLHLYTLGGGIWTMGLDAVLLPQRRACRALFTISDSESHELVGVDYRYVFVTAKSPYYNPAITNQMRYEKYRSVLQALIDKHPPEVLLSKLQSDYDAIQVQKQRVIGAVRAAFPSFHNVIDEDDIGEYLTFYETPAKGKKTARVLEFSLLPDRVGVCIGRMRFSDGQPVFRDFYGRHYMYGRRVYIDDDYQTYLPDGTPDKHTIKSLDEQMVEVKKVLE